jgi:flagellar basal-body rod protein FlgC
MNLHLLPGIDSSTSALTAERVRLQVIAQNIANAMVTRGPDGRPYQRQQVVFESVLQQQLTSDPAGAAHEVRVARIEKDQRPLRLVHNPSHPDANAEGMVAMPNVNVHEEMADMIAASRSYEANLAVIRNARQLTMQTLSIGKR